MLPVQTPVTTLHRLREMHARREKIAMLTCYDAAFARLLEDCGVDVLLVGDSLGMVLQGQRDTLSVTLETMCHHTRCVAEAARRAWIVADLPFGSYGEDSAQALRSASRLMQAGAQMVKLEGGGWTVEAVRHLVERGIPVCGHLGLTPQSVHALGGFRQQCRDSEAAERLLREARELAQAGCALLVLECIPSALGRQVADALSIPVIGIGAGADLGGQVLVLHDMLGITPEPRPSFVQDFSIGATGVADAVRRYVRAVKEGRFPPLPQSLAREARPAASPRDEETVA